MSFLPASPLHAWSVILTVSISLFPGSVTGRLRVLWFSEDNVLCSRSCITMHFILFSSNPNREIETQLFVPYLAPNSELTHVFSKSRGIERWMPPLWLEIILNLRSYIDEALPSCLLPLASTNGLSLWSILSWVVTHWLFSSPKDSPYDQRESPPFTVKESRPDVSIAVWMSRWSSFRDTSGPRWRWS